MVKKRSVFDINFELEEEDEAGFPRGDPRPTRGGGRRGADLQRSGAPFAKP